MAERPRHKILWDLEGTIGDFRGAWSINPEFSQPLLLRYGINDLLNEFSEEAGYSHVITSSASLGYIMKALRSTHMDKKFSPIFDNETVKQTMQGKHYYQATRPSSLEHIRHNMIVIGDSVRDKPVDIGGLVFVELGSSDEPHDALVIREILTTVLEAGEGNFKQGYEALHEQATPDTTTRHTDERRILDIGNDIKFTMEYRIADEVTTTHVRSVPTIYRIRADSHKKPFQPFF